MTTKCSRCGLEDDSVEFDEERDVPICTACKMELSHNGRKRSYVKDYKKEDGDHMNYKHYEHVKIVDNKWEAKRIAQSRKNLGYKARVVRRHFEEGSVNYDVVYSKHKKLVKV